jgi:hypothetical protein
MSNAEVDCVDILTRDRFLTNYVCAGRPVVIKGGVRGLPQSEWDFDGLLHRVDLDFRLLRGRRRRVSCGNAGFDGPGVAAFPWGRTDTGSAGQGMADAVDGGGEFLCPGPGFGDPQDQVAGSFDQAGRSV